MSLFVERDGYRFHYSVFGEGRPTLLLHAAGPGATGLGSFARNIDGLARTRRLYIPDFPGWGKSSKNFGDDAPPVNGARAMVAFLDALGLDRVDVVGITLGASTAIEMAMSCPDRVDRIVAATPGGGIAPDQPGPTQGFLELLGYYQGKGPTLDKMRSFSRHMVHDPSLMTEEMVAGRYADSIDPEVIANPPFKPPVAGAVLPPPLCRDPRLADIRHRILMIWGSEDRVNPSAGAFSFGAIPNLDLLFLAQAGHWVQWERPDAFNAAVDMLLNDLG